MDHEFGTGLNAPQVEAKTITQVTQELLADYNVGQWGFLPARPACELGSSVKIMGRDDLKIVIIAQPGKDNNGTILTTEQIGMVDWD